MIDEKEIMPFNFFSYGGVYSGEHKGMRYKMQRKGEKPDFCIEVSLWQGPYCSDAVEDDKKTFKEFEWSEEGRIKAIEWLKQEYEERKNEWDSAPLILDI